MLANPNNDNENIEMEGTYIQDDKDDDSDAYEQYGLESLN
jgi:hypothetical protein